MSVQSQKKFLMNLRQHFSAIVAFSSKTEVDKYIVVLLSEKEIMLKKFVEDETILIDEKKKKRWTKQVV